MLNVFLICLLASTMTTVLGVLIVSLVCANKTGFQPQSNNEGSAQKRDTDPQKTPRISPYKPQVDPKFQFLHHLTKSKVEIYLFFNIALHRTSFQTA